MINVYVKLPFSLFFDKILPYEQSKLLELIKTDNKVSLISLISLLGLSQLF